MEKRLILAIALSFLVIFGSNYFMSKYTKKKVVQDNLVTKGAVPQSEGAAATGLEGGGSGTITLPPTTEVKDITVKTKLFTAVFTNVGGALKSFKLNDYKVYQKGSNEVVDIVTVSDINRLPLDVQFANKSKTFLAGREVYNFSTANLDITADSSENRLVFSYLTKDGLEITKTYTFSNDKYNVDLEVNVKNASLQEYVTGRLDLNWTEHFVTSKKDGADTFEAFAFDESEKKVERATAKDLNKKQFEVSNNVRWAGFCKKFFMVALIPDKTTALKEAEEKGTAKAGESGIIPADIVIFAFSASKINDEDFYLTKTEAALSIHKDETRSIKYHLYLGPQKSENLKEYNAGLQGAINYGFFAIIAAPLMWVLKLFYGFTQNYGLAIIILTIAIKVLFYPLTQKSFNAMKDMQKITPLLNQLKEKYKDDKERLNREILELYKKHRVNPLGGCFPILLQMPVFIALYKVLMNSVELRHAPFYLWITDLSSKDPYYITPVVMGISMLIQQKMTPSSGDNIQQKMMLVMPVVFTFMFSGLPSGLVIYWLVSNIISILQQGYIMKKAS